MTENTVLEIPQRTGYDFNGFVNSEGLAYSFDTAKNGDTYYAKWSLSNASYSISPSLSNTVFILSSYSGFGNYYYDDSVTIKATSSNSSYFTPLIDGSARTSYSFNCIGNKSVTLSANYIGGVLSSSYGYAGYKLESGGLYCYGTDTTYTDYMLVNSYDIVYKAGSTYRMIYSPIGISPNTYFYGYEVACW